MACTCSESSARRSQVFSRICAQADVFPGGASQHAVANSKAPVEKKMTLTRLLVATCGILALAGCGTPVIAAGWKYAAG